MKQLLIDNRVGDNLPEEIKANAEARDLAAAIDAPLQRVKAAARIPAALWRALSDVEGGSFLELPDPRILDHLAWGFNVIPWDRRWPPARKAARLADAIATKRRAGTIWAIRKTIESFGYDAEILPWFDDPAGEMPPHWLRISINSRDNPDLLTPEALSMLWRAVMLVKSARDFLDQRVEYSAQSAGGFFGAARFASVYRYRGKSIEG